MRKRKVETVQSDITLGRKITLRRMCLFLQRKPFAFELFFCLANEGFFTFSSKTPSIVKLFH